MKKIAKEIKQLNILTDSQLNTILDTANNSWELFYNCNIQIFENNDVNHKIRLKHLKSLRKLQQKNKCDVSVAHNFSLCSKVEQELSQIKQAINSSIKSYELFSKSYKTNPLALNGSVFAYSNLANIYSNLGLDNIALDYLHEGQKLVSRSANPYIPNIRINMTLANIYSKLNKFKQSTKLLEDIYVSASKKKYDQIVIPSLVNLANIYHEQKNYTKALELNDEALNISKKIKEAHYIATIINAKAKICEDMGNLDQAFILYKKGLKENNKIEALDKINANYYNLGCLLLKMDNNKQAINYFEKIINNKSNGESLQYQMNAYKNLADIFEKSELKISNNYYKKYIEYFEKNYEIKKELFAVENKQTIESLEVYIDNIQKEKENEKLKAELNTQKRELITKKVKTLSENNFLTDIIIELKKNISEDDGKIRKKINATIELLKHRIDSSSDWKQFLEIFNELNPTFLPSLENKSSDLSELELRVCAMIKFGLQTREIANILSITIRGVEQHRYRIKKKLDIEENLTIYLRAK